MTSATATPAGRGRSNRLMSGAGVYAAAALLAAFVLGPVLWMVVTALKPRDEVFTSPPHWIPHHPTFENFGAALDPTFLRFMGNSLLVCTGATLLCVALALLASYTLSRPSGRMRHSVLVVVLVSQLLPQAVLLVPLYRSAEELGLLNSYAGLVVVYLTFTLPVAMWLLHGFIAAIPAELEEAAQADGLSSFRAFLTVIVPLARPGIAATAAFVFFTAWQDFMFALVFLTDEAKRTLPLGVLGYMGQYTVQWGQLMAASTLLLLPIMALFVAVQRHFVAGLTVGAVKG
ncbi:carbohydrate ABC transporter permease [Wenjunlia tyrosinilytica]|uniref:ABC transporter permease n=1 Tax=Wenjunlia tyrosinilytica TaxID=1544741 RepID=A0A918DZM2_9ACTN|nr:carbohydrate ABC transporter permease [Wenjunlia tyrosinilytica]GGO94414.1 ABC transporter permease [Wenjunlia tyrosinilytica]